MFNFLIVAQNSEYDYVKQACLCAMSIRYTNPTLKVSIMTDNKVPEKYVQVFDNIIDIPWNDQAKNSGWKIENRWKAYHVTPYEKTIMLDSDMLFLSDVTCWDTFLDKYDLFFVDKVKTYKNEIIENSFYRNAFREYNLPNLYTGLHYYRKSDTALEFYQLLKHIINNWPTYLKLFSKIEKFQRGLSIDLAAAIAIFILDKKAEVTSLSNFVTFTHMKTRDQKWKNINTESWRHRVIPYINNNLELIVGNIKQQGVFHYTEKQFLNEEIIKKYEKQLGI
jgi:hypothetical protein